MTRKDAVILTLVVVIPGLFVCYEMAALNGIWGLHTISAIAQANYWLDVAVIALAIFACISFIAWWIHHMRTRIPR